MDKTFDAQYAQLEKEEALKDLFFDPKPEEYPIKTENALFTFTIQGLSQFEVEAIGSDISKEVHVDPKTEGAIVHVNQSMLNLQLLLQGVTRAACNGEMIPWNEETVKRLRSEIRNELLTVIKGKSDGLQAFKKNSLSS